MLSVTSRDGTRVQATDEGEGPTILVLHPGLDDGSSWRLVASRLASRFRVVRLHRRPYRLDLPNDPRLSMALEVEDVQAVIKEIGEMVLLVGHSSGAVVALEALVASPTAFSGVVLYEPPLVIGSPLGGEALEWAREAIQQGKPGKAMAIFVRDIVRERAWVAPLVQLFVSLSPRYKAFAPRQIDEVEAIEHLGKRLDAYRSIDVPVLLVGGEKSPSHLGERLDALARTLPKAERVVLRGQGHSANTRSPDELAQVIAAFADRALG